ncbi:MAG: hypothetical protein L0212_08465 [Acidobacteria bacterium]|nr:hypothetical protein [Acidobacteriota bacterium]
MSISILVISAFMLVFWLRSASRSILQERFEQNYSAEVAEANNLEFLAIRNALSDGAEETLDYANSLVALERDYEALTYLLRNAATVNVGRYTHRERLLVLDFQLMRVWVRIKRTLGFSSWQSGLVEMATILEYFGNVVGQRLVTFPSRVPVA